MGQHVAAANFSDKMVATLKHALLSFLRAQNLALVRTSEFDASIRDSCLDWLYDDGTKETSQLRRRTHHALYVECCQQWTPSLPRFAATMNSQRVNTKKVDTASAPRARDARFWCCKSSWGVELRQKQPDLRRGEKFAEGNSEDLWALKILCVTK